MAAESRIFAVPCFGGRLLPAVWHTYVVGRDPRAHKVIYVKIGRSRNPVARINTLQTFSPTPLKTLFILEGDRERELHQRFAAYRTKGEWFRVSGELREFIREHTEERAAGPSFHAWLLQQIERSDDVGRLALVVKSDLSFPANVRKLHVLIKYMERRYAHLTPLLKSAHKAYRYEARR